MLTIQNFPNCYLTIYGTLNLGYILKNVSRAKQVNDDITQLVSCSLLYTTWYNQNIFATFGGLDGMSLEVRRNLDGHYIVRCWQEKVAEQHLPSEAFIVGKQTYSVNNIS